MTIDKFKYGDNIKVATSFLIFFSFYMYFLFSFFPFSWLFFLLFGVLSHTIACRGVKGSKWAKTTSAPSSKATVSHPNIITTIILQAVLQNFSSYDVFDLPGLCLP
jgi:hypothetical protein